MGTFKGSLVLLKIGDGGVPAEQFRTVGGLRTSRLSINRQTVNVQDVTGQGWRVALEQAGIGSVRIQGQGIFAASEGEGALQEQAISGAARNFRFYFGNGDQLEGGFIVSAYERTGIFNALETVSLTLESAGKPIYTVAEA